MVEGLYYPCSENKGYREADLRLCFRIRFSHNEAHLSPEGTDIPKKDWFSRFKAHLIVMPVLELSWVKIGTLLPLIQLARIVQSVAHLGLLSGVPRLDFWFRHLSLLSYW